MFGAVWLSVLKYSMAIISIFSGIFCLIKIKSIPNPEYPVKKNFKMIVFYSSLSVFVDILFIIITLFMIPQGTYEAGGAIVVSFLIAFSFAPFCLISSRRLQKRMSALKEQVYKGDYKEKFYKNNHIGRVNCTKYIPWFKCFLFFLLTVAMTEVP